MAPTPLAGAPELRAPRPFLVAARTGLLLGVCSAASLTVFMLMLRHFVPLEHWGASAAGSLGHLSSMALFVFAAITTPLFETVIGQLIPIELARYFGAKALVCVLTGGAVFGLGHFVNGGVVHGIAAFLAGSIFSYGYVRSRHAGAAAAYLAAATAHGVHNAVLLFIVSRFVD